MESNIVPGARAHAVPSPRLEVSPVPIFSNEFNPPGTMWPLARTDRSGPGRDLGTARLRADGEEAPSLLLDRYAVEPCLQSQALRHFVVQIADDDGRHDSAIVAC